MLIAVYASYFVRAISQHIGQMIIAPIPKPTVNQEVEVIKFKEKEVARKEIIDSMSIFAESVFYTYLMLFKLLIGSGADAKIPFMFADLSLCQLFPPTSL